MSVPKNSLREVDQRGLEVHERDSLVHHQAFDLGEGRRVGRIEGILAVDHAGNHHPNRRLLGQQGADLHRRGMGPEQEPPFRAFAVGRLPAARGLSTTPEVRFARRSDDPRRSGMARYSVSCMSIAG